MVSRFFIVLICMTCNVCKLCNAATSTISLSNNGYFLLNGRATITCEVDVHVDFLQLLKDSNVIIFVKNYLKLYTNDSELWEAKPNALTSGVKKIVFTIKNVNKDHASRYACYFGQYHGTSNYTFRSNEGKVSVGLRPTYVGHSRYRYHKGSVYPANLEVSFLSEFYDENVKICFDDDCDQKTVLSTAPTDLEDTLSFLTSANKIMCNTFMTTVYATSPFGKSNSITVRYNNIEHAPLVECLTLKTEGNNAVAHHDNKEMVIINMNEILLCNSLCGFPTPNVSMSIDGVVTAGNSHAFQNNGEFQVNCSAKNIFRHVSHVWTVRVMQSSIEHSRKAIDQGWPISAIIIVVILFIVNIGMALFYLFSNNQRSKSIRRAAKNTSRNNSHQSEPEQSQLTAN